MHRGSTLPPKAIFIDIDGTLLSHTTGRVPKSAVQALQKARNHGILLFIATGRNNKEVGLVPGLEDFIFDGFMTMNGSLCYIDNDVIFKNPLKQHTVAAVVDRITNDPFPCIFAQENDLFISVIDEHIKSLQEMLSLPMPRQKDPAAALDSEIFQIAVTVNAQQETFLRSLPMTKLTKWRDGCFDLVNDDVNKWEGITHVLRHFGLNPHEVAAIGDGDNDIEMLANAGFSVAMGNASDAAKSYAGYVTRHIDDDGFAYAIEQMLKSINHG